MSLKALLVKRSKLEQSLKGLTPQFDQKWWRTAARLSLLDIEIEKKAGASYLQRIHEREAAQEHALEILRRRKKKRK